MMPPSKRCARATATRGVRGKTPKRTSRGRSFAKTNPLHTAAEDDESTANEVEEGKGFDGEGFAGYLAPYALALLASIAVTAGVFKFVLLDY